MVTEELPKTKEKLSAICGKVALECKEVYDDYRPKVYLSGIKEGKNIFLVKFILVRNSDLRENVNKFISTIRGEFKNKLIDVSLR